MLGKKQNENISNINTKVKKEIYTMNYLQKLSPNEISNYYLTTLGELLVLCVNIIESSQSSDIDISEDLFENALMFMQKRHPLMRASLLFETNQIFYKIHDTLPLNRNEDISFECLKSKEEMIKRLETYNCKLFDYKKENSKLWRAFLFEFIGENRIKQYAVGFLMPLFITGNTVFLSNLSHQINLDEHRDNFCDA